jgi:hypothetical protein
MNLSLVFFICIIFMNYNSAKVVNKVETTTVSSTVTNRLLKVKRADPYDYDTPKQAYEPSQEYDGGYRVTTVGYQTTKSYYRDTTRPYIMPTVYVYPTTTMVYTYPTTTTYYYVKPTTQSPY